MRTLVMKFGGASVASTDSFEKVAQIIMDRAGHYEACVVVVSAMEHMTDHLIGLALKVHPNPPQREYDMLISVGERVSVSLLAMALNRKGVEAFSFTGSQSGIITNNEHTNARIVDVRPTRLLEHLKKNQVVIVAGFQGVSLQKDITTLGRGGSDTSAVALGVALGADKVEFYKDVEGVYDADPKLNPTATLFKELNYSKALSLIQGKRMILHPRCITLAQKNSLPLHVLSFNNYSAPGTVIADSQAQKNTQKCYEEI